MKTRSAHNAMSSRFDAYRLPHATAPSRTWAWNLYGTGLERLGRQGQPEEIPLPQTRRDQLLVRVDAVSLCYSDVKVLMQGSHHPKLVGRDLAAEPTRLGHEVALTVIEVGEALRHRFRTGERLALQPDIYHHGTSSAYGYTIPGGLVQHQLLGPEVLEGDGGCPLVPVGEEIAYAEIALSEPWACVEAAYTQRRRLVPKRGGILWIRGRPDDRSAYAFSNGLEAPAMIVGTDLPASLRAFAHEVCARSGARLFERNGLSVAQYRALAAELTRDAGFDDIVLLEPLSSEVVGEAAKLVARRGTVNLVGREPLDAPVPTDAGRIHYDYLAFVGSRGPDIAASYGTARNRCELRPGGTLLVVGAAGPMGQMHVARALEHPAGPGVVLAADVNPTRLAVLSARCQPLAERSGRRLLVIESSQGREDLAEVVLRETRGNGVDDVVVCVPDGAVASESARLMKRDGMLVLFAGVPRGTVVAFDLSSVYLGNAQLTGTSGSTLEDQVTVLRKASAGQLVLGRSVAAVGGMEAAPEGLRAVMEGRYPGKVVLFPQLRDLPLTPLSRLEEAAPEAAEELTDAGEWSFAAERALIAKYWKP